MMVYECICSAFRLNAAACILQVQRVPLIMLIMMLFLGSTPSASTQHGPAFNMEVHEYAAAVNNLDMQPLLAC
jgi:hypothetical protein